MKTRIAIGAALAVTLTATTASAELLDFVYTSLGDSNGSASWTQSSTPTPNYYVGLGTSVPVTNGTESYPGKGSDTFEYVFFTNAAFPYIGGGFEIGGTIGVHDFSVQLYTVSEASPSSRRASTTSIAALSR